MGGAQAALPNGSATFPSPCGLTRSRNSTTTIQCVGICCELRSIQLKSLKFGCASKHTFAILKLQSSHPFLASRFFLHLQPLTGRLTVSHGRDACACQSTRPSRTQCAGSWFRMQPLPGVPQHRGWGDCSGEGPKPPFVPSWLSSPQIEPPSAVCLNFQDQEMRKG